MHLGGQAATGFAVAGRPSGGPGFVSRSDGVLLSGAGWVKRSVPDALAGLVWG